MAPQASPGPTGLWPNTPWTAIRHARAAGATLDRRAITDRLVELYYQPVQRYFAGVLGVSAEVAGDIAHDLFTRLLESDFLDGLPREASFRAFLKLACRRQRATWLERESAGRRALQSLAVTLVAEDAAALAPLDLELRRSYVEEALRRLRADLLGRGKADVLAIFEARTRFDGSHPDDYGTLAKRFGLNAYDVQNRLARARKLFRKELLRIAGEWSDDPRGELRELGLLRVVEE